MNLTKEQKDFLMRNQRSADYYEKVSAVAEKITKSMQSKGIATFSPEEASTALLISNIGEKHPDMTVNGVSIYSKEYGKWDDKAKELNASRGQKSVEMAQEQGIEMSPDMMEAISTTSTGKTPNLMAVVMKMAQTYEAIKKPRWSRGVQKEAAKDFAEVQEIMNEEIEFMLNGQELAADEKTKLTQNLLESVQEIYVNEKREEIHRDCYNASEAVQRYIDITPYAEECLGREQPFTETLVNRIINELSVEQLDEFVKEIADAIKVMPGDTMGFAEGEAVRLTINKYKELAGVKSDDIPKSTRYDDAKVINAQNVSKATQNISVKDAMNMLDTLNPDKNQNKNPGR